MELQQIDEVTRLAYTATVIASGHDQQGASVTVNMYDDDVVQLCSSAAGGNAQVFVYLTPEQIHQLTVALSKAYGEINRRRELISG